MVVQPPLSYLRGGQPELHRTDSARYGDDQDETLYVTDGSPVGR